jgi:hypothetical protein
VSKHLGSPTRAHTRWTNARIARVRDPVHWTETAYQLYLARQHRQHPRSATPPGEDLPEAALLAQVRALARQHGWSCYHTRDSRGSDDGFPDLVLVNATRVIFAELKSRTGKLTEQQARWLEMLRHTGHVEVYTWRPGDWHTIVACLARPTP